MTDYKLKIESTNPKIIIDAKLSDILVPGSIPDTVRELIFGDGFNGEIEPGLIPMGTQVVEFGNSFNQKLKPGVFPNSVECIKFGKRFNKSLKNVLPENLKILYIGCYVYNHPLNDVLPSTITDFHLAVSQFTNYIIPHNVTELYIYSQNSEMLYNVDVPRDIKKIYISPAAFRYGVRLVELFKNCNSHTEYILLWDGEKKLIPFIETYDFNEIMDVDEKIIHNFVINTNNIYGHGRLTFYHLIHKKNNTEKKIKEIETENAQLKTEIQQLLRQNNDIKEKMKHLTELFAEII